MLTPQYTIRTRVLLVESPKLYGQDRLDSVLTLVSGYSVSRTSSRLRGMKVTSPGSLRRFISDNNFVPVLSVSTMWWNNLQNVAMVTNFPSMSTTWQNYLQTRCHSYINTMVTFDINTACPFSVIGNLDIQKQKYTNNMGKFKD